MSLSPSPQSKRMRLDAAGIFLSGLCAVHCVLTIVLVSTIGFASSWLLAPELHWYGLLAATIIAAIAIGTGVLRHRRPGPLIIATIGLLFMAGALIAPHGVAEASLTIVGVLLVLVGHVLNLRPAFLASLRKPG